MKYIFFILACLFLSQAPAQSLRYNGFYYGREFFQFPDWKQYPIYYYGTSNYVIGYQRAINTKHAFRVQYLETSINLKGDLVPISMWYSGIVMSRHYRYIEGIYDYLLCSDNRYKNNIQLSVGLSFRNRGILTAGGWFVNNYGLVYEISGIGYTGKELGGLMGITYKHRFCSFGEFNLFGNYRFYKGNKAIPHSIASENTLSAGASIGINFGKKHVLAYK